jgi:hypothetical protein
MTSASNLDISCCFQACQPPQKCVVDKCAELCYRRSLFFLNVMGIPEITCWIPFCLQHEPRLEDVETMFKYMQEEEDDLTKQAGK